MFNRLAAHLPAAIRNLPARARRVTIGAAAAIPALLISVPGPTHTDAPKDSGLLACAYPLPTQDVPATAYPKIRAQFAGSRWLDLRTAGTAYVDLAVALRTARGTDGYQTVWFYQRLSAVCAKHGQPLNGSTFADLQDLANVKPALQVTALQMQSGMTSEDLQDLAKAKRDLFQRLAERPPSR
jgi:hypothetical protein